MHHGKPAIALAAAGALLAACQSDLSGRTAANNAAVTAGYPFSAGNRCDGEVSRQLQTAGVQPASVESISYLAQQQVIRNELQEVGFDANVRMVGQPGLLVVDLTEECFTRQVYTRDGLSLPGISSF
ncbi:MAG: hypothetical protein R3F55_14005 [Alphaproteobacteria bacterium]